MFSCYRASSCKQSWPTVDNFDVTFQSMEIKYLKQYLNQPRHLFTLNILRNVTLRPHWRDIPFVNLVSMKFRVWLEFGRTIMVQKK